jgi:DNA-directed RNA polymerase subunit RPC12/RpoP
MALINCPECGKEISDQAISCPSCGYRVTKVLIKVARFIKSPLHMTLRNVI